MWYVEVGILYVDPSCWTIKENGSLLYTWKFSRGCLFICRYTASLSIQKLNLNIDLPYRVVCWWVILLKFSQMSLDFKIVHISTQDWWHLFKVSREFPLWLSRFEPNIVSLKMKVQSVASLSRLRILHYHKL